MELLGLDFGGVWVPIWEGLGFHDRKRGVQERSEKDVEIRTETVTDRTCIKFRKPVELPAAAIATRVDEIGRGPAALGDEITESQDFGAHHELDELGFVGGDLRRHGAHRGRAPPSEYKKQRNRETRHGETRDNRERENRKTRVRGTRDNRDKIVFSSLRDKRCRRGSGGAAAPELARPRGAACARHEREPPDAEGAPGQCRRGRPRTILAHASEI